MEPKIQLLYDYEIIDIAKKESLALIPMIGYLQGEFPAATFEDIERTIAAHLDQHGFTGVPKAIVPKPVEPVVEPEIVEPEQKAPVEVEPEDHYEDLHEAKPRQVSINIRNILQEIQGKV